MSSPITGSASRSKYPHTTSAGDSIPEPSSRSDPSCRVVADVVGSIDTSRGSSAFPTVICGDELKTNPNPCPFVHLHHPALSSLVCCPSEGAVSSVPDREKAFCRVQNAGGIADYIPTYEVHRYHMTPDTVLCWLVISGLIRLILTNSQLSPPIVHSRRPDAAGDHTQSSPGMSKVPPDL
jgi:hypothetical protein